MVGGRLVHGAASDAGEIGHVVIDESGTPCGCGKVGCLETWTSVPALTARIGAEPGRRDELLSEAGHRLGLALAPVVRSGQLHASLPLIVDAKSGVSGAGRTPTATTHFCEAHDDLHAYGVTSHRHTPEIRQTLGTERVLFTPHLVPMNRGIFVTCYAQLRAAVAMDEVRGWFHRAYAKEHFIRLGDESLPAVRNVAYTNYCDIGWRLDSATGMLIVCAAIDNLGKGAAGQAVQNFNAMFQMHEALGLERG